jgi:CBS domain containing-hemolysin-like protein
MAAYVIRFFIVITYPVILMTQFVTNKISHNKAGINSLTKAELIESTLLSEGEGVIDEHEADVIENVLQMDDIKAKDILTPRSVVYALEEGKSVKDAVEYEGIFQFSRMPVYHGSIDNVTGIVLTKKVFQQAVKDNSIPISEIKKEIFRINENIPISKVLDMFIKKKEHMFLVVDSYGQTEGIITLEDCIETLLGVEIMDESDTVEDMREFAKQKMKRVRSQGL